MGKKRSSDDLVDYIEEETISEIVCSKCDAEYGEYEEAEDFAKDAFRKGWRATQKNVYCPKCAIKYLR